MTDQDPLMRAAMPPEVRDHIDAQRETVAAQPDTAEQEHEITDEPQESSNDFNNKQRLRALNAFNRIQEQSYSADASVYDPTLSINEQVKRATKQDIEKARRNAGLNEQEWLDIGLKQYLYLEKLKYQEAQPDEDSSNEDNEAQDESEKGQIMDKIDRIRKGELTDEDNDYEFGFERTKTKDGAKRYYLTYRDPETDEEKKAIVNREAFFTQRLYQSELVDQPQTPVEKSFIEQLKEDASNFIGSLLTRRLESADENNGEESEAASLKNRALRRFGEFLVKTFDEEVQQDSVTESDEQETDDATDTLNDTTTNESDAVRVQRSDRRERELLILEGKFEELDTTLFPLQEKTPQDDNEAHYYLVDQDDNRYPVPKYVMEAYVEHFSGLKNKKYPVIGE